MVIASEAKQSMSTLAATMDCFAALVMTADIALFQCFNSDLQEPRVEFRRTSRAVVERAAEAASRLRKIVEEQKLEVIRLSFPDQHGILRGKTLVASEAIASLESGCSITTTMLAKDTSHKTVFPVFTAGGGFGMKEMEGAADVLMVADTTTFRVLPWAPTTGWLLCDLHFSDGRPVPFATRHLYREVLDQLGSRGYDFVAGLEVEFHLFKLEDAHMAPEDAGQPGRPPSVSLLSHGYQYLTEQRYDQMEPALEIIRRDVLALGLPLRSVEVEFGPSQCEFTFAPTKG